MFIAIVSEGITEMNVALGRRTRQSSVYKQYGSDKAVDGNTNGNLGAGGSCTHTNAGANYPWWAADLEYERVVLSVHIYNRVDRKLE